MRKDQQLEEIKKQAAVSNQYQEPVSGFCPGDAEEHMERLHEMYFRFTLYAAKGDLNEDLICDVANTYDELRTFLQQVTRNGQAFDELKNLKPVAP